MSATPVPFSSKDNATGRLNSGIGAAVTSIPLQSGNGANYPQPYTGTATSLGTAITLNCTGISAAVGGSAVIGKFIWNKTDSSICVITAVATNSITTTRLLGGTNNIWSNSDTWCIDPFVVTFSVVATTGYGVSSVTQNEEALITARSTDTLTVAAGGRGYNGTSANTFSSGDYVYLNVTSPIVERFKDLVSVMAQQQDTDRTTLTTANTNIGTLQDGTYHYVITSGSANAYVAANPALGSYTAGNLIAMKANFTNTGAATINLNSLGAKSIKKNDGVTALAANDIISGQIVILRYDGTNFQMLSPSGTPVTAQNYVKSVYIGTGVSSNVAGTADTNFDTHTYTIPANDLVSGVAYRFRGFFFLGSALTYTFSVKLGSTAIVTCPLTIAGTNQGGFMQGIIMGTTGAGASVAVNGEFAVYGNNAAASSSNSTSIHTANVATNGTLALQWSVAKSGGGGNSNLIGVDIEKISTTGF